MTHERLTISEWAMGLAVQTSKRSTCLRRSVGCVLLDKHRHVLATGYNGVARGLPHCNHKDPYGHFPHKCPGSSAASGENLDGCEAIHAEQNALLQCRDVHQINVVYVTTSPCVTCVKLLLNTSCNEIIYKDEYPHVHARELWLRTGRVWTLFL